MCHNEMEWIDKNSTHGLAPKLMHKLLSCCFRLITLKEKFHFILLSSWMEQYFKSMIPEKNRRLIHSIDHAYIRPENTLKERVLPVQNCFKIGIPAAISEGRGLHILKQILEHEIDSSVKIFSLSYLSENIEHDNFETANKTGSLLPFDKYNKLVTEMDALLFLYEKDSYKLTASGAILEAIWNEKPIVALHNHYFDYIFDKFGSIGCLCDSIDEIVNVINNLNRFDLCSEALRKNIKSAKRALLPDNVVLDLRNIIE